MPADCGNGPHFSSERRISDQILLVLGNLCLVKSTRSEMTNLINIFVKVD